MIYNCKNIVVCLLVLTAFNANAEMNDVGMSQGDMAKMSQNPVGNMYSVPPLDFKLQAFTTVVRPAGAPEWSAMFSVKMILPKALFAN